MEIARLRDIPGVFTASDVEGLVPNGLGRILNRQRLDRRVASGELEKYSVQAINNAGDLRHDLVAYRIPGTTKVDKQHLCQILQDRSYLRSIYELLPGTVTTTEYKTFWQIKRSAANKRLHRLQQQGVVTKVGQRRQPTPGTLCGTSLVSLWKRNDE